MHMIAAPLTVLILVGLSACVPGADAVETVDVDIVLPTSIDPDLPDDPGTIVFATGDILADLDRVAGDVAAVDDILASEASAGAALRSAYPRDVEVAEAQARVGQPIVTTVARSMVASSAVGEAYLAGTLLTGMLAPIIYGAEGARDLAVGARNDTPGTGASGTASTTGGLGVERTADNALSIEATQSTSSTTNGKTTTVKNSLALEGTVCPSSDGEFDFTVRLANEAAAGDDVGGRVQQELTVRVTGRLGEDGYPETMTIDGLQGTRHAPPGGKAVYVETRQRLEGANALNVHKLGAAPAELVRASSLATDADIRRLASTAGERLAYLAWGAVMGVASSMWNGGCVSLEAPAPGRVKPASSTEIAVTTRSRLSGESFPADVALALSGPESISSSSLKSPDSFTYTAGEAGTSATITLESASRRGTAKLVISIATDARAYRGDGTNGDITVTGIICDLAKPFSLSGTGVTVRFEPVGEGADGTYSYADDGTYGGGLIELTKEGTYTVALDPSGTSGTIAAPGVGTTAYETPLGRQEFTFPGTDHYTLTALDGAPSECAG